MHVQINTGRQVHIKNLVVFADSKNPVFGLDFFYVIILRYMKKEIFILNTLSKEKEKFTPLREGEVKIYHCGPTVYWNQHIGNMRAVFFADIINRVFRFNNYKVILVRNYTDVGHLTGDNIGDADTGIDRMEKASLREGLSALEISNKYISSYLEDIKMLNVILPDFTPSATEHIVDMINMVEILISKGFAYITDLAVYFDVKKAKDYYRLSGQKFSKLKEGEGFGQVSDLNKRNSNDFALWFFRAGTHSNILQFWSSPFKSSLVENGQGFPGWHIECSAMSKFFLGNSFDIHLGGIEHIPIHHTNEIAQSENANGEKYVNYWMHNEHLLVENKKMSKSEGTSFLLSDVISMVDNFDGNKKISESLKALVLRYFFLQAHYRSKQNFTTEALKASFSAYNKLLNKIHFMGLESSHFFGVVNEHYINKFTLVINDDFNTPKGLAILWELIKDKDVSNSEKLETIFEMDKVLGLNLKIERPVI